MLADCEQKQDLFSQQSSFPSSIQNSSSVTVSFPPRAPSWLRIIAEGKHSYDLEYQLPTEAP